MKFKIMKGILLITSLLLSMLSYAQNNSSTTIIRKGNPTSKKEVVQADNADNTFDGTFYIVTDKKKPEQFLNNIFSIVRESREENKDVKIAIGDRSTLIIFSKKKIRKENFIPVKEMVQTK